jgi:hypothetical protein
VLNVAFDELARRGTKNMSTREVRCGEQECQDVLQLIAEAERAARLV